MPVVVGGLTIQKLSLQNGTCCHCHDVRSDTCSKAFVRLMAMAAIASGTGADVEGWKLRHDTVCALSNSVPHIKMACLVYTLSFTCLRVLFVSITSHMHLTLTLSWGMNAEVVGGEFESII